MGTSKEEAEIQIDQARKARDLARKLFKKVGAVNGIGISRLGKNYAVKVNLENDVAADKIPATIGGVPVVVHVVGKIRKQ